MTLKHKVSITGLLLVGILFLGNVFTHIYASFVRDSAVSADRQVVMAASTPTATPDVETGPLRVGLQAGHWKNSELPDELENLRLYGGGSTVGSLTEWEVNLDIAQRVARLLEAEGMMVDILPATIPPGYTADLFISIHADGNEDTSVSGYKVAAYEADKTGSAELASEIIAQTYAAATNMEFDPNITENMTRYYAFNTVRFNHAISEETPGILVEVGYLTSAQDRRTIVSRPEQSAQGIATGVIEFFDRLGKR